MATPGTYVSGAAHVGLIGWLILGWGFQAEPLPFEIAEVSVVTGEEYARLVAATTPQPDSVEPEAPPVPEVETPPETAVPEEEATPVLEAPEPVAPPEEDTALPEVQPSAQPPDTSDALPDLPPVPETPPQGAPDLPPSETPQERQADRVAPTPVAPPPDDVAIADIDTQSADPVPSEDAVEVEEDIEETAQEETATAIVPEDLTPSGAVETSVRPSARPNRPAPAPTTPAETETASSEDVVEEAVDDAVAAALESATAAPDVPQGPPMTFSEEEGFRVSVQGCWNVGALSSAAQRVIVTVSFRLDSNKRVVNDVVELVSSQGGDSAAEKIAYDVARRAILQCQVRNGGFDLPDSKFDYWEEVELTFDPTSMRLR